MRDRRIVLTPVRPNAGVTAAYRKALVDLIDEMHRDLVAITVKAWTNTPPVVAQDRTAAESIIEQLRRAGDVWIRRFDAMAKEIADRFVTSSTLRARKAFQASLRKAGFAIRANYSPMMQDVISASVAENVTLIKSIATVHLAQVQGAVMRSVQNSGDLGELTTTLRQTFGVTKRRAAFIARDQNAKATAAIVKTQQLDAGITEAIWLHSAGGKTPRPTHVAAGRNRTIFDVREGWVDPALNKAIWPGSEPNCRCVSRAIIPALRAR